MADTPTEKAAAEGVMKLEDQITLLEERLKDAMEERENTQVRSQMFWSELAPCGGLNGDSPSGIELAKRLTMLTPTQALIKKQQSELEHLFARGPKRPRESMFGLDEKIA